MASSTLKGKRTYDVRSDSLIPLNPLAYISDIGNNLVRKHILDYEEIKEEKVTMQKSSRISHYLDQLLLVIYKSQDAQYTTPPPPPSLDL
ncbi:hypothetical protein GJ744_008820 [Endocarpon pusillum]|uniref:Uncharacterized protein n=1 Tax=Endocarpon pusillum TaxID=364733 RepID=A0A8H7AUQ0_9EURO|nr:hypothetical protein GJ744_008820 [Endocarpon pusillum]